MIISNAVKIKFDLLRPASFSAAFLQRSGIGNLQTTGKLQDLSEISWFAWVFWLVLVGYVLCCLKASHHWKNVSTLMVCLGKKQLGMVGHTSPWLVPGLGTYIKAFTHPFGRNIFICLLSANKDSPVGLWKIAITGKFGLIRDSTYKLVTSFGKNE